MGSEIYKSVKIKDDTYWYEKTILYKRKNPQKQKWKKYLFADVFSLPLLTNLFASYLQIELELRPGT